MQFDFNIPPNQSTHLAVAGIFFKYKSGTGTLRVRLDGGGYIDLLPGQGISNVKFNSIDLQDRTGLQNAGVVLAGMYDFRDDTISGTVTVRDSSADLVLANKAFVGQGTVGQSGANLLGLMLYNPAGSGKIVKVRAFRYTAPAGVPTSFQFRLGAYVPTGPIKTNSKLAGGAQSGTFYANEAVTVAAANALTLLFPVIPSLTSDKFEFRDPIVLPPGFTFLIHNGNQADVQTTYWNIEFTEE